MLADPRSLRALFKFAAQNGVSDIHFRVGQPPAFRLRGDLVNVKSPAYTHADLLEVCRTIIADPSVLETLDSVKEYDGSFDVPDLCRFRFNIFRHDGNIGIVMRIIPNRVPTLESLRTPDVVRTIAEGERGFVLVTGATGMGKSTTLAAMVDHLNATSNLHIVTIEDPVEFVHKAKKSRVTQREVGRDTRSFADALRAALRQDPDVILVGEMRDAETVDIAIKAAETGHLVLSTAHTLDASKTIGRIISMFPPEEQTLVRLRLADTLKATISQRLLRRSDGKGRIAAQEIMVVNGAIQECIINPQRTAEIPTFIENATELLGSQTFAQHLVQLYRAGTISFEEAKSASTNPSDFERNLKFEEPTNVKLQMMTGGAAPTKRPVDAIAEIDQQVVLEQPTQNGIKKRA